MEFDGIPIISKFNDCKNRVQHQHIFKTYLSGIHVGQVQTQLYTLIIEQGIFKSIELDYINLFYNI